MSMVSQVRVNQATHDSTSFNITTISYLAPMGQHGSAAPSMSGETVGSIGVQVLEEHDYL